MNLPQTATDNVTEVLLKIIEFTRQRQRLLYENISNAGSEDFVPQDFPVDEFSRLLNEAVDEHVRSQRLVLKDTLNVKFGINGSFELKAIPDTHAGELYKASRDEYLNLQINKLMENSLNLKVAAQLLGYWHQYL
jgi:flagellar basal body rod protein FlgB